MIKTILCISDTHNMHRRLREMPEADVLVHCGDFTEFGTEKEALDFLEWFCDLPYRHKIFTTGNHDVCLYEGRIEGLDDNVHFLKNDGITLEDVKFYGVPFFIAGMEDKAAEVVPDGTDIVISHEPPFGILDDSDFELGGNLGLDSITHYGSTALRERICKVKPKYSLFGHVHSQYGTEQHGDTTFINASIMAPEGRLNSPVLITFQ